jgi:SulP family sulfate permease
VPEPGVLVLLFATPLWYANANQFHAQMIKAIEEATPEPHGLALDAFGMSDIDYTGARALSGVLDELDRRHIKFAVARAGETVTEDLTRSGLLAKIGSDRLFASAEEAVDAVGGGAARG